MSESGVTSLTDDYAGSSTTRCDKETKDRSLAAETTMIPGERQTLYGRVQFIQDGQERWQMLARGPELQKMPNVGRLRRNDQLRVDPHTPYSNQQHISHSTISIDKFEIYDLLQQHSVAVATGEKGSRTPEVVQYRRRCADEYEQVQGLKGWLRK